MPKHQWQRLICLLLLLTGCGTERVVSAPPHKSVWKPPSHFVETDLIGRWELWNNTDAAGNILLNTDHTFIQSFDLYNSTNDFTVNGTWRIENRPSGCIYIHLVGMRLFQTATTTAERENLDSDGTPIPFVDRCENTFVRMPNEVTLIVGNASNQPRGILLLFPRSNADGNDEV